MSAQRSNERGNAFFIVMISVVLFAALMFAFSRGVRQGGDNMSGKQAEIAASDLVSVAQQYQRAVSRLRLRGCAENQISFETDSTAIHRKSGAVYDFSNAATPGDDSCKLFAPAGAGLTPYEIAPDYVVDDTSVCANCVSARSMFFTTTAVTGVGTDSNSELMLWLGRVNKKVCTEINKRLGVDNPGGDPPVDSWDCNSDPPFQGTYETCVNPIGDNAALTGKDAFCVDFDSSGWTYIFMTVLIER